MALSPINRALTRIPKRAEQQQGPLLHETFVDSGVVDVLDSVDHQVLYGQRGTGKTHAFSYLASEVGDKGDIALAVDLRTIGSAEGLANPESGPLSVRAGRLLVDLLGQLHEAILNAVFTNDALVQDVQFVDKADQLLAIITATRVVGPVEQVRAVQTATKDQAGGTVRATVSTSPALQLSLGDEESRTAETSARSTRSGDEQFTLNFTDIVRAFRDLGGTLGSRRIWILLDEWSSVPRDLQPYLAEFLLRCIVPVPGFTLKIAAIEQQSSFRVDVGGRWVGLELGADLGAHMNLDDYLVYEGNESRSRAFFLDLLTKHVMSLNDNREVENAVSSGRDLIREGFADSRAFDELVRAAEGVPRDALYIAARAALRAGQGKITVPLVRESARTWFQTDKTAPLTGLPEAELLLNWIVDRVIREKRARAFLVSAVDSRSPLLQTLFDARVLHVVRKG